MPAWIAWAIVAVLLAVGEAFTPGLFFIAASPAPPVTDGKKPE